LVGFFFFWNLCFAVLLSPFFYFFGNANPTGPGLALFLVQSLGHFGLYLLVLSAFLALLLWPFRRQRRMMLVALLAATVVIQLVLIADLLIFGLYRYHLNGLVWWVIKSPEGRKTLGLDALTLSMVGLFVVTLGIGQGVPFLRFWRKHFHGKLQFRWPKSFRWAVYAVLLATVVDKSVYAYMDLRNRTAEVSPGSRSLPWYWRVTVKKWYARTYGYEALAALGAQTNQKISRERSSFSPAHYLIAENASHFDVLFIVVDSWRSDMLNPDVMPRLSRWAEKFSRFNRHYSGGNGTRDGMFSLMSATHSMRWFDVLNEPEPSPMVAYAKQFNYQARIRSSTSLEFPEFRRTIFFGMTDDQFYDRQQEETQHGRDILVTQDFLQSYAVDDFSRPRFDLLFLDSAHGPFSYPPGTEKFHPSSEHYFNPSMFSGSSLEPIFNRYRNACHFIDGLIDQMLTAIHSRGRMDNTIIVITGDHGEEFYEFGYWGHTSAFTDAQIQVPLVLHIPGRQPQVFEHRTRHVDVLPSVMAALGVTNDVGEYSQGFDIFQTVDRDAISCGWDRCAIYDGNVRLIFGSAEYNMTDIELMDRGYKPISSGEVNAAKLVQAAIEALSSGK
jgi:membrane-anchored protein YejM (alkaline phosphatase superfamily)